eukprot:CAMPEP_0117053502 /NCGR_PEP_ID=MMETSP0472-20121206/37008_1 /TAXON_ID=693140 ORGANISM="Tiarina fusus, Strain LIS" /NCGR_SAMPLE_ID=MMETSP0472 /ASSEMBLY_ACC=CAM_ASM_000603 /LENGTH=37 /DNA_ID= /DNA_START= /DNA_END= /DNA_ORIENTATION=
MTVLFFAHDLVNDSSVDVFGMAMFSILDFPERKVVLL